MSSAANGPSPKPTAAGRLIAVVVGVALTVAIAEVALRAAMPHWRDFYSGRFMRAITVPGYGIVTTGVPGFDGHFAQNNGDFRVAIRINALGLRNDEPASAAAGRIWVVGDSMAFGWGVERNEMYSSVIAKAIGTPAYNVASPGTDVCGYQALVARMPKGARPRAVVVGLILENDILEYDCKKAARAADRQVHGPTESRSDPFSWHVAKRWLTGYSALYNFFAVALKRVDVIREALTALGVIKPIDTYKASATEDNMARAVEKTAAELANLRAMLADGTPFAVLIAPGRFEIKTGDAFYAKLRRAMTDALKSKGIAAIDPFQPMREAGYAKVHFAHDGHWSALGHRIAGEEAARWLKHNMPAN